MESQTFTLTARHFFDGENLRGPTRIDVVDGVVSSVAPNEGPVEHHLVSPGLVDLQVNGWDDVDFGTSDADGIVRVDSELARLGTTTYLATLVTDSLDRMGDRIDLLHSLMPRLRGMAGIHLEGPFLGGAPGAHRTDRIIALDEEWLALLPSSVRLVTLGAEQPGLERVIPALVSRGVTVSLGHSRPSPAEYESAVSSGARMCTHLFNAMSGVHHREFGLALAALTDDRVTAGLIADLEHVSAQAIALAFRARPRGIALVSDSVGWRTSAALRRGVRMVGGAPRLPDGTLAGSSTHLAGCLGRAVSAAGADLEDALRSATSIPANLIGESGRAIVAAGRSVDLVAYDADLRVAGSWLRLVSSRGSTTDR